MKEESKLLRPPATLSAGHYILLVVFSVGYDLKSNELKSQFEILFLNCDFDFKSFCNARF